MKPFFKELDDESLSLLWVLPPRQLPAVFLPGVVFLRFPDRSSWSRPQVCSSALAVLSTRWDGTVRRSNRPATTAPTSSNWVRLCHAHLNTLTFHKFILFPEKKDPWEGVLLDPWQEVFSFSENWHPSSMLSHRCDFSVFKMHNKESSDPPVAAGSIYKYVPRITRSWVCALYAAGVIRTTSQTVICYFIRCQGDGGAFISQPLLFLMLIKLWSVFHFI